MRKRHYHLADPPELIAECLSCARSECTNCLERRLKAAVKTNSRRRSQSSTASPGCRKWKGNSGWVGESGKNCVSRQNAP